MLDVRRHGVPILDAVARHKVITGIAYGVQIPGMVPLYEELSAQAARGLTQAQWQALPWRERAFIIAHDRLRSYIGLHQSDAQSEAARQAQERNK